MDDSKLLELAGLAAGETYSQERNPLERDDLALRLAVKLVLKIEQRDGCIGVQWVDRRGNPEEWPDYLAVPINGDPYAATRRAIVRAAAEIGRAME